MRKKNMFASVLVFFVGFASMAQGATPPPPAPPPPSGLPIDDGIVVLFIIAFGYGVYKMYKLSQKRA